MHVNIDMGKEPNFLPFIYEPSKPFFSVSYSDTGEYTLDSFLKAMCLERIEDAMVYISKNYLDRINLEELSDILLPGCKLCVSYVLKTGYHQSPKDCINKAFLVMEGKSARLFNIYMLKEPNRFGKWKIYSIEKEESIKGLPF